MSVIELPYISPGEDIQPLIDKAFLDGSDGDVIKPPKGSTYIFNKNTHTNKRISLDTNGCKFIRHPETTDADLKAWGNMITYEINDRKDSGIVISGIEFESREGGSAVDGLLKFINTSGFTVTNCKFTKFGYFGIAVQHEDTFANGLIYNNYIGKCRGLNDFGYGGLVYGENNTWRETFNPNSRNIIVFEDNILEGCRHSLAGGGNALYMANKNLILENYLGAGLDAHEKMSDTGANRFPTRLVIWSNNTFINKKNVDGSEIIVGQDNRLLAKMAGQVRGGEAVIYGNTVTGYRDAFAVLDYTAMAKNIAPLPEYRPKVYHWENTYTAYPNTDRTSELMRNYNPEWYPEVYNKVRPGYQAEIYPHPKRLK